MSGECNICGQNGCVEANHDRDIIKYFVEPGGASTFEIYAETEDEARHYIKKNFRGSGDVRLIINRYVLQHTTPFIVRT